MKLRGKRVVRRWALGIWFSSFFLFSAEVGSWAYVKLLHPPNLHLYPLHEAWLHGFEPGLSTQAFYLPKAHHQQSFCRDEFCTTVSTNNAGFRTDKALTLPLDVAVVGDSFAFGWGVEVHERYANQLQQQMAELNVISLAYPNGHSPPFYELFLKQHPQYWPHLLIVQLFAWNDLNHDQRDVIYLNDKQGEWTGLGSKSLTVVPEGYIDAIDTPLVPRYRGLQGFVARSWFGRLLQNSLKTSPSQVGSGTAAKPSVLSPLDQGTLDAAAYNALAHVEELARLAAERQTHIAILYVPFATLAGNYPALCEYQVALCAARANQPDPLGETLKTWAASREIAFVDPLKVLRDAEKRQVKTYFARDGHWTANGHQIIAERLKEWICETSFRAQGFANACGNSLLVTQATIGHEADPTTVAQRPPEHGSGRGD